MLFRRHTLWFDDTGRVIVTRDHEDDTELHALANEVNRALTPNDVIVLLTPGEALEALAALEDGHMTICPYRHLGGDVFYYVGAPWRHPLAQPLDMAIHAVNLQGKTPALWTLDDVLSFLNWTIAHYEQTHAPT